MKNYEIDLVDFIEIELIKHKKSKKDFFKEMGMSTRTFYKIKHRKPTTKTLNRIANCLDIDVAILIEKANKIDYEKRKDD